MSTKKARPRDSSGQPQKATEPITDGKSKPSLRISNSITASLTLIPLWESMTWLINHSTSPYMPKLARIMRLDCVMIGINTNNNALAASAKIGSNAVEQTTAMQRLSTGVRVNSAKDDAAALAISTGLISQIKGMAVATRNVNDGISLAQTAESALGSVVNMLQRMRELAVQSANGTLTTANRAAIQLEYDANINQINTVLGTTNFNGIKLFDGSASALSIQSGASVTNKDTISIPKLINPSDASGSSNSISGGAGAGNAQAGAVTLVNNDNVNNSGYSDYLSFNGTGQSLIGNVANIPVGNSARTFEMNIQIPLTAQNVTLFQYGDPNNLYQSFSFRLYNGNLVFWGGSADYLVNTQINDGLQHKLAITYDGNGISWYIDNNLITSSTTPHTDDPNLLGLNGLEASNFNQLNTASNTQFVIGNFNTGGANLEALDSHSKCNFL